MSQNTHLVYQVNEKPPLKKNLFYALQQLLAIMAATILVPQLVNYNSNTIYMDQAAALCGAGFGTLFYLFMTQRKSPVFLGSSFAFISPLVGAVAYGYAGIFMGAVFAGAVYIIIAMIIKVTGTNWVNKLLPPVVIGPTVALIGLSLCASAITNLTNTNGNQTILNLNGFAGGKLNVTELVNRITSYEGVENVSTDYYSLIHIGLGVFAFLMTVWASIKGGRRLKMIPFIIGIVSAYAVGLVLTLIGRAADNTALQVINLDAYKNLQVFSVPRFNILGMMGRYDADIIAASGKVNSITSFKDVAQLFILFAPVAFVTLAEHIADHKNLSSIIGSDLTQDPGLGRTLVGDGGGSIIGSFFGGCPNTTYGESVGCVAITGNASSSTILIAALYCIVLSFFGPFTAFVNSIPSCITGGVCIALYGFIAVSGLKMLQPVDLSDNRNLFVVAAILVPGIGGLELKFEHIKISAIATALILGIIVNVIFNRRKGEQAPNQQ